MKNDYLIVHRKVLPTYFEKVLEMRQLLESGSERDVSSAARRVGISRSTYYKYKDYIFDPGEGDARRKAVLSLLLSHEVGVLSNVLNKLSESGANVLAISQSLPIRGLATVLLTIDIGSSSASIDEQITALSLVPGVENAHLLSLE